MHSADIETCCERIRLKFARHTLSTTIPPPVLFTFNVELLASSAGVQTEIRKSSRVPEFQIEVEGYCGRGSQTRCC